MSEALKKDSRQYPTIPVAGVGAVVFYGEKILLIKRGKEPSKGKWSVPGGGVELGETLYEAARREVMEECSVEIEVERVMDAADNIVKDTKGHIRFHYIIIDLLAKYKSGEIKAGDDAEECGWFTPAEAAIKDLTPTLRTMLERHEIIKKEEAGNGK
jgi:8-oxo-dGTP diphosphatase